MSDDLNTIPRRLRRFYRHGEPIPESENDSRSQNSIQPSEQHDENEPWMNARPAKSASPQTLPRVRRNERKENVPVPKQGLFSQLLHHDAQPRVTPMDHALGLHEKEKFDEKLPSASEKALAQNPPLPQSATAQKEIQQALQELRALAKNDPSRSTSEKKPAPSLTSFHFTPAGEVPHAPAPEEKTLPASPAANPSSMSPRERAEQRKQGKTLSPSSPATSSAPSESTSRASPGPSSNDSPMPAHIRRRMGQLIDNERMDREDTPAARDTSSSMSEKDDEDFKSLFSENSSSAKKKKKKESEEDDLSMDDEELELFEDEK